MSQFFLICFGPFPILANVPVLLNFPILANVPVLLNYILYNIILYYIILYYIIRPLLNSNGNL